MQEDRADLLELLDSDDWGTTASVGDVQGIPCIFRERPAQALGLDGALPSLWCLTEHAEAAEHGTPVQVDGRSWTVSTVRHDGTGMSTLLLTQAPGVPPGGHDPDDPDNPPGDGANQ